MCHPPPKHTHNIPYSGPPCRLFFVNPRLKVGRLWTSLADYFIRRGLFEKARDVYEEGLCSVITVHDFSLIYDAYTQARPTWRFLVLGSSWCRGAGGMPCIARMWPDQTVRHRTPSSWYG